MKNIKTILFIGCALLVLKPFASTAQNVYSDASLQKRLDDARNNVCNEQFANAITKYAALVKTNDNKTVSAEYAYALALTGCYDGAVMNLDKIYASGQVDKNVLFFSSQVLKLMEHDSMADCFWTQEVSTPPSWISNQYKSLLGKHKSPAAINTDAFSKALQRANHLADQRQYLQSTVLFLELIEVYPDQYLPCIGLSALMENLGFKQAAAEYLQKGIERMGSDRPRIDFYGVYDKHLEKLKNEVGNKSSNQFESSGNASTQASQMKQFIHTGLSYFNQALAFNVMYGLYTSENTSLSINLGYTHMGESSALLSDLSFNFRWWQDEIVGVALSAQYSGGSFDLGAGARAGWSFPLPNSSSSIDFLYSIYYYFKNEQMSESYSIGYTRYF